MMAGKNASVMNAVMTSLRNTGSAHTAVREGIATHAEKHRTAMHEAREKLAREAKVNAGIARANSQVHGTS